MQAAIAYALEDVVRQARQQVKQDACQRTISEVLAVACAETMPLLPDCHIRQRFGSI